MSGLTSERLLPEAEARLRSAALTAADVQHILGEPERTTEDLRVADVFPFRALCTLASAVITSRPAYAPHVADGTQHVQEWLWAKEPTWRRSLLTPDGEMVAHVGVKSDRTSPSLEMVRLMVHPDWQRQGLAGRLVHLTVAQFGTRLRALVGPETPSHLLLRRLRWTEGGTAMEPGEPDPAVVMICPHERTVATR